MNSINDHQWGLKNGIIIVTSGYLSNTDTSLCPLGVRIREVRLQVCAAPKGMVFGPFWSKTGIHFAHFGLEMGMDFEETTGVDVCIFVVSVPNEY